MQLSSLKNSHLKNCIVATLFLSSTAIAAGVDSLAKPVPAEAPKVEAPAQPKQDAVTEEVKNAEPEPESESEKPEVKKIKKSTASKSLENRLSLGTSVGWSIVKPAKGTWIGLGASDIEFKWRQSRKEDGKLFITGRYAPFAGVWTVNKRDYDTTLHGIYGGAELQFPTAMIGAATLKAGVELGYMMVYAKPQDKAPVAGEVKGGKLNLTAGGGADWGVLSNKVKIGPYARVHVGGFSMFNVGGSARFVF